jgi:hypothetical protein
MTLKLKSRILSIVFRLQLIKNHIMNGAVQHTVGIGKPYWKVMVTFCFFFCFAKKSLLKEKVIFVDFQDYIFVRCYRIKETSVFHFFVLSSTIRNRNVYMTLSHFLQIKNMIILRTVFRKE